MTEQKLVAILLLLGVATLILPAPAHASCMMVAAPHYCGSNNPYPYPNPVYNNVFPPIYWGYPVAYFQPWYGYGRRARRSY